MPPALLRHKLRFNLERLADALLILSGLLALSTVFAFLAPAWWAFDLFSHFRVQYVAAAAILAISLWALRRRRTALLPLAVVITNVWFVVPLFARPAEAAAVAPRESVRVLALNVFGFNNEYDRVMRYVQREKPDVLILLEVTPEWAQALTKLAPAYAYQWVHAGDLRSGIAVFSRRMPVGALPVDLGGTGEPSLLLTLPTADGPLSVLGVHLYWPLGDHVSAVRNRQLQTLARIASTHGGALVVAGDFNITPFSPHFPRLLRDGRLRDCAEGRGFQPTWPARVPVLFIPIDHCLASHGVSVRDFRVGDYVGSDHYPIVMDVGVARRP